MATVTTSKQYSLNVQDFLKGLLVAVLSPVVPIIMSSLNAGTFVINWAMIGTVALGAAVGYLVKNFMTPSQIVIKNDGTTSTSTTTILTTTKI